MGWEGEKGPLQIWYGAPRGLNPALPTWRSTIEL